MMDLDHKDGTQWQEKHFRKRFPNNNTELSFLKTSFGRQSIPIAFPDFAREVTLLHS